MRKGMTLLSLVVVILIIAVIATVVGMAGVNIIRESKMKTLKTSQQTIITELEEYKSLIGDYPKDQAAFNDFLNNTVVINGKTVHHQFFSIFPQNPFFKVDTSASNDTPKYGWLWDYDTLSVIPITSK